MAKKSIISVSADNDAITFTVEGAGTFTVTPADLSEDIRNRAMIHGLVQKVSDAAAISRDELTGDPVTDAKTKLAAMSAVADRLSAGEWSKRTGEGGGPVAGIIYRAFEEYVLNAAKARKAKAPTAEAIRARYDAMDRKAQLGLRNVPEIAAIIERMKSERGGTVNVDADALLGELLG